MATAGVTSPVPSHLCKITSTCLKRRVHVDHLKSPITRSFYDMQWLAKTSTQRVISDIKLGYQDSSPTDHHDDRSHLHNIRDLLRRKTRAYHIMHRFIKFTSQENSSKPQNHNKLLTNAHRTKFHSILFPSYIHRELFYKPRSSRQALDLGHALLITST